MHPRLLTTPFFTIHTFGVLLAAAYVAAFWWLMREGRRERIDIDLLSSLAFWAIAGAIIGAKALMVLRDVPEFLLTPSDVFSWSVLAIFTVVSSGHWPPRPCSFGAIRRCRFGKLRTSADRPSHWVRRSDASAA